MVVAKKLQRGVVRVDNQILYVECGHKTSTQNIYLLLSMNHMYYKIAKKYWVTFSTKMLLYKNNEQSSFLQYETSTNVTTSLMVLVSLFREIQPFLKVIFSY